MNTCGIVIDKSVLRVSVPSPPDQNGELQSALKRACLSAVAHTFCMTLSKIGFPRTESNSSSPTCVVGCVGFPLWLTCSKQLFSTRLKSRYAASPWTKPPVAAYILAYFGLSSLTTRIWLGREQKDGVSLGSERFQWLHSWRGRRKKI